MSHTPGPWRLIPDSWKHFPIVQRGASGGGIVLAETLEIADADARLIAAAPDLLEALEGAKKTIVAFQSTLTGPFFQAQLDSIDAAISKATEGTK